MLRRHSRRSERGQVLVVVAASLSILLVLTGFAVDLGRQAAQRRYLQNAADAAALAGCQALIDRESVSRAEEIARNTAVANLARSPAGAPTTIATSPVYETGHNGDPSYLINGIRGNSQGEMRVALTSNVNTVMARVAGIDTMGVNTRSLCDAVGGPSLPIVARRYDNPAGPGRGFVDRLATAATSTDGRVDPATVLGYDNPPSSRLPASRSAPGPIFTLYGPDSKADNEPWFSGLIALDIRNYEDAGSRVFLNGLTEGALPSTTRDRVENYILRGYPGPEFPPVNTTDPDFNLQVGTIPGLDAAQIQNADKVYNVGDEVVLAVYSGTVMEMFTFSVQPPETVDVPRSSIVNQGPAFYVYRHGEFNEPVHLDMIGDNEARNLTPPRAQYDLIDEPMSAAGAPGNGKMKLEFSVNDFIPVRRNGTRVVLQNIHTVNVDAGIYTVWLVVTAGSPVHTRQIYPLTVRADGATRDFNFGDTVFTGSTDVLGGPISIPVYVMTAASGTTAWGGSGSTVRLSVDTATLPAGLPASQVSFSSTTVTPNATWPGALSNLNIDTTGLAPGTYRFQIRAFGTNGANQPVTHLQRVTLYVATDPAGDRKYVDIIGWALFRITEIGGNYIRGEAISGIQGDLTHQSLIQGQRARLLPWR